MRTKKIAIIASLLIVTLVTSLIAIFSKQNTKINEVALQESKKLSTQSTISYEEVKSGDSDVYYEDGGSQVKIDNFELDAYFIEDSKKQRGVTKNLSEITNLSVIVNASQFVNMKIKNLSIRVSADGIVPTCTTSDSADGVIQQVYDRDVFLNDLQGGINSTINFSIRNGININDLSENLSRMNTVTFNGICEYTNDDGSTRSYPFTKTVEFTVDWTGQVNIINHNIQNYSNNLIGTADKVILNLAVSTMYDVSDPDRLINKQAEYIFEDLAVKGVKPIDVQVYNQTLGHTFDYEYNKTEDKLTYTHYITEGSIPYGYNSIVTLIYPRSELEAALNNEIFTKTYTITQKIAGIGNPNIVYNNTTKGYMETDWVDSSVNIDFKEFNGNIIGFTNRIDALNKANTRISYSKNEIEKAYYNEVWNIRIALGNYFEKLEIERYNHYKDGNNSACFFDGTNNEWYAMDDCKSYRGFELTSDFIYNLGGEDNIKIEVYGIDASGKETKITKLKHQVGLEFEEVTTFNKPGNYFYIDANGNETSYKQIRFVIGTQSSKKLIPLGDYWICQYMEIDNSKVRSLYNIDTFDKFSQIHSATQISGDSIDTKQVEYIMPASAGADYVDGGIMFYGIQSVTLDVVDENKIVYQATIGATDRYQIQYIENPTLTLELPDEFTSVNDVTLEKIVDLNENLTLDPANPPKVFKAANGRIIIKASFIGELMKTESRISYNLNLNVPEDEIKTSMPEAQIRTFLYADTLDGLGLMPYNPYGYNSGLAEDIYDIDGDGYVAENQCVTTTNILYKTPSGMETYTFAKATVDGEVLEERCPNTLGLVPNKTNKATIDVDLYLFYLDTTISDLKIMGRIPYIDNTFVLDNAQDNLGTTFNTTMTSAGIKVPSDIKNHTTVYYSTTDATMHKGTATTVNTSIWKTQDQVTDWSKIKSYLIVIDNAITNDASMNMSTFSYDINLPTDQEFGLKAYATHAVEYVSKVGDGNSELMQTETNKVGISFVTDTPVNIVLTKKAEDKTTGVSGAKYELSNYVTGEEIDMEGNGTLVYSKTTTSNPTVAFTNLYQGIKYKLTETEAPAGYDKHDPIVFEIKMNTKGEYYMEIDTLNSPSDVIFVNEQKYTETQGNGVISGGIIVDEKSNAEYKVQYYYEKTDGTYEQRSDRQADKRSEKIGKIVSVLESDKNPIVENYELEDTHVERIYEGEVLQNGALILKVFFKLKNANYRVEYYYQMQDGSYVQKAERPSSTRADKIGKTVEVTEDDIKPVIANYAYESAHTSNVLSGEVKADNSLVLKVYFNLQEGQYKVEYYYENEIGNYLQRNDRKAVTRAATVGTTVTVTDDDRDPIFGNYEYESSNTNNVLSGTVMDGTTLVLKVYFGLKEDSYKIEYYYENQDGSYSIKDSRPSVTRTGTLGESVSVTTDDRDPKAPEYKYDEQNEKHVLSGEVKQNGGLVLKVYFNLKEAQYKVRYYYENANGNYEEKEQRQAVTRTGKVGATVYATDDDKEPKFTGYVYEGGNSNNVLFGTIAEDNSLTLKVYFKLDVAKYKVEYYYENDNGSYGQREDRPAENRTGTIGETVAVTTDDKAPKFDEYEFDQNSDKNIFDGTVDANGELVLKVYFNLKDKDYKVEYYYQNDNGTYTQRNDRKPSERTGTLRETVSVTSEDTAAKFDNYEFERGHQNNVLSDTLELNKETTLKVYFKLINKQYKVEYYYQNEDGTYTQRADRKAEDRIGKIGETVYVTDNDRNAILESYEYEGTHTDNKLSDTLEVNKTTTLKVHFKFKKAKYKVEYYYQNVGGTYSQRSDRAPRFDEGIVSEEVTVTNADKAPVFNNYVFESENTDNVLTGTVAADNSLTLKVYFKFKLADYTVEYYYEQKDGTYKKIAGRPDVKRTGTVDDTASVTEDDRDSKSVKYEYEDTHKDNVLSGTIREDNKLVLKVHFKFKKAKYKVEYYYQNIDGTYSQRSDRVPRIDEGVVSEEATVTNADKAPVFNNYVFESENTDNVLTGTVAADNSLTLKVYFKFKLADYTVEYYYEQKDGSYKKITGRPDVKRTGIVDDTASITEDDKDSKSVKYEFESAHLNNVLSGTIREDNKLVLKVHFKFKKATYKVEYYYQNVNGTYTQRSDRAPRVDEGVVSEEVNVTNDDTDPLFNNYVFENTNANNRLKGNVLEDNSLTLKVYFKFKIADYTVEYYYEQKDGTYQKIAGRPDAKRKGIVDDIASVIDDDTDSKFANYEFEKANTNNVLTGTIREDNKLVLKVYFKFKIASYKVQYYYENEDGTFSQKSTRDEQTREGIVTETASVTNDDKDPKSIHYEFVEEFEKNVLTGTIVEGNGLVLKVYFKFKKAEYTVRYYYEQEDGSYKERLDRKVETRIGTVGYNVDVTDDDTDPKLNHYVFEEENQNNILNGIVAEDNSLELRLYFKFKKADYRIQYYYENRDGTYSQRQDRPEQTRVGIVDFEVSVIEDDKDPKQRNYEFENDNTNNKLSGIVLENNGLVLKVYFKFKIADYKVEYYYENKDGSYNKIATRPDVTRTGIAYDTAEVTTDDKDPRNEYYTLAIEHNGNALSGVIAEDSSLVLKVHFRLKKIIYNLDLNKQTTNGETLAGTKFSVYLDDATTPMFDNTEVTTNVELQNQVLFMGEYDLWITENSTVGDPYINILDGRYIKIRMNSTTNEEFEVVGANDNENDDFFEVYESDKVTKVTDENILKWIDAIVDPETNTLTITVKNPIQYNVNITTVDTLNTFVQGNAYSVYRNESLLCTESVTTDIERNEYLMGAGTYDYYFTQNNFKDRYINILNGRFVKVSVTVAGNGDLSINAAPKLYEGNVGDANAKEITAEEITKYFNVTVNNETAISSLELHVVYPVTFNVEVDKMKTDNEPLENTEIKISSPIINDQNHVYDNEQISGIDSITSDGTVTGTTDYVIDDGTQARVSYAETYVHANANGYYTYEITEVTPAGGQYVNILEGYKVVLRIKVSGNGDLTLVDENGNPYAENVDKRFTIVATGDKEVTEDLYDYVFIGIDNNTVRAVLNADVINPIRYKMAVHQSLYGTEGRVKVVDMPVKVNDSELTNRTIEKSPVWATEKVEYKVTQDNPVVDNGLINVLDGHYIGVDVNIPGDGDIKTIASNGDKTTNSYRIYKADGTEVNFNETHIDDFVKVQVTKDNNNVCTVNIYVEVPQEYDVKLLKIDNDTKEALNDVEFSMVAKYEGNEIKLKDITKNSDQILTNYLKTANVDGEDGIIKLNNILIEKAGTYTFVLTETTPDPKPEYRYKDKKGSMIIEFEVTEGDGLYVIESIGTNNNNYSEAEIGDNNLVELTVKNERITGVYGVEITKISELLGLPLQGSEFSIRAYKKNADGEDEDVKFYSSVIKNDDTQVVPGTFDINSEDGINNYEIMIENTDKHFLEIKELKAPDTYTKLAEPIVLKVTPKLVGEYDDAKYVIDTTEFMSGDNEGLVKLTGYEDEKIKLEVKNNQFDLALRQYVSSINGEDITRWNTPEIDTSKLVTGEDTTAEFYNNKNPLRIFAGQEVIYTFRVYNEGQIDGYANEIVAYLPEQLEFLANDEFNISRNWVMSTGSEISNAHMTAIKTDYLSKAQSADNLIKAFDHENNEIDFVEVQVKCKIRDDEDPRQTVTTLAEITKFEAPTRPEAIDRDSNQPLEIPGKDELPEYKYKNENENGYVPGDEDDDDFEKLHIEKFDLAAEKFVTSINYEKVENTEPSFEVDKDGNHINYKETNNDLKIADGNMVEYTIRAYNHSTIDAYADVIEEELPKELIFDKNNPINVEYGWKMLDENRNETDDATKAKYLVTDYLSKASGEKRVTANNKDNLNLMKEFDAETMEMPDYRDVKVILRANLPTEKEGKIVNIARVTSGTDSEGISLKDEELKNNDSEETIDIVYFDLSISKWITETVTYEKGNETVDATGFEGNKDDYPLVKIDIKKSKVDKTIIKIKYNIKVTNEGSVPGYAKEITDYIPDGLKLDPADNPNWTLVGNSAVNTELKDKLLAPGEDATVSIVLTWVNIKENVGLKVNVAEITEDYNEQGDTKDIDSVPANKNFEEDDLSDTTKMLISIKTGEEQRYTLIIIAVGAIIGVGIVAIKKYVVK